MLSLQAAVAATTEGWQVLQEDMKAPINIQSSTRMIHRDEAYQKKSALPCQKHATKSTFSTESTIINISFLIIVQHYVRKTCAHFIFKLSLGLIQNLCDLWVV